MWGDCDRGWATPGPDGLLRLARSDGLDRGFLQRIEEQVAPSDLLVAICTSGSTAEPKIVMHTHGSVIRATQAFRPFIRIAPNERNYTGMPLFWLGGLNVNLLPVMYEGACMVFAASPRFDDVLEAIERERVTRVSLAPAQQAALAEIARARGLPLASVKRGLFEPRDRAGVPIPEVLRTRGTLGMTETFGPHGSWRADEPLASERAGSAGQTLPGIAREIVDPETGAVLPHGETGELFVRGYPLMEGYYKRERSEVFKADGFFPTGDLCALDAAGFVYVRGRRSEMIKTSGANVAPAEVEAALLATAADIQEAVVFGVPDARKGEKVVGVLVPKPGSDIDVAAVKLRMKGEISTYKVPEELFVLPYEAIPRTASGKAVKPKLKEMWASGQLAPPPDAVAQVGSRR
jgi:acyl-CoA synthetase (AMP-forming)/AMP-acid ligase II